MASQSPKPVYRISLPLDDVGEARDIEFDAVSPDAALRVARDLCSNRSIVLFQDGEKLTSLRHTGSPGFWLVG